MMRKADKRETYVNKSISSSLRSRKSYDKAIPENQIHFVDDDCWNENGDVLEGDVLCTKGSNSKDESNEFGFGEYAETVGPQGLLFVLKGKDKSINATPSSHNKLNY